jgi:hypothetical protein
MRAAIGLAAALNSRMVATHRHAEHDEDELHSISLRQRAGVRCVQPARQRDECLRLDCVAWSIVPSGSRGVDLHCWWPLARIREAPSIDKRGRDATKFLPADGRVKIMVNIQMAQNG